MDSVLLKSKESKLWAFTFSMIALAFVGLVRILFNIVIGNSFGDQSVEILGMANIALSATLIISLIPTTAFPNAISKFVSDSLAKRDGALARRIYARLLRDCAILTLVITALVSVFSQEICDLLKIDPGFFLVSIPIIILFSFYSILRAMFYALGMTSEYFKREILSDAVFFIGLAVVLFLLPSYWVLLPFSVMYFVFICISIIRINKKIPKRQDDPTSDLPAGMISFMGFSTVGSVMGMATVYMANIITGIYLGPEAAGIYAAAFSTASIPLLIQNGVAQVILPEIAFLWGDNRIDELKKGISVWSAGLFLFAAMIIGPMIILSQDVIGILFGNEFLDAAPLMTVILLAVLALTTARASILALIGTEHLRKTATISVASFIIAFILWIVFIPVYGIIAAALGYLVAALINAIVPFGLSARIWKIKFNSLVVPALLFTILVIGPYFIIPMDQLMNRLLVAICFMTVFPLLNFRRIMTTIRAIKS